MRAKAFIVILAAGLFPLDVARAHHSFVAEFDEKPPITLTGVPTKLGGGGQPSDGADRPPRPPQQGMILPTAEKGED